MIISSESYPCSCSNSPRTEALKRNKRTEILNSIIIPLRNIESTRKGGRAVRNLKIFAQLSSKYLIYENSIIKFRLPRRLMFLLLWHISRAIVVVVVGVAALRQLGFHLACQLFGKCQNNNKPPLRQPVPSPPKRSRVSKYFCNFFYVNFLLIK